MTSPSPSSPPPSTSSPSATPITTTTPTPLISPVLISCSSHRDINAIDWHDEILCFGSGPLVAIGNTKQIFCTLPHSNKVNAVRFIKYSSFHSSHFLLFSGLSNGDLRLWSFPSPLSPSPTSFPLSVLSSPLPSHQLSIESIFTMTLSNGTICMCAADSEGKVSFHWFNSSSSPSPSSPSVLPSFHSLPSLCPPSSHSIGMSTAMCQIGSYLLVAVAGTQCKVFIYSIHMSILKEYSSSSPSPSPLPLPSFTPLCALSGPTDWIRSMDFRHITEDSVLLASSSQDKSIWIWKITVTDHAASASTPSSLTSSSSLSLPSLPPTVLTSVDSVVHGHDEWVLSVRWSPRHRPLELLSSSTDKSSIIWKPQQWSAKSQLDGKGETSLASSSSSTSSTNSNNSYSSLWLSSARLGELGGSLFGFYSSLWSDDGCSVLLIGFNGDFHLWGKDSPDEVSPSIWSPRVTLSGHFGSVKDITWDSTHSYLLSTSVDQTTRVWGKWSAQNGDGLWHEMGRPQIHGYDMICLTAIQGEYDHLIVSGGEEKVIRAFLAPNPFVETMNNLCKINTKDPVNDSASSSSSNPLDTSSYLRIRRALRGVVPELQLTNKGLMEGDTSSSLSGMEITQRVETKSQRDNLGCIVPPSEDHLYNNSQWVEIDKLFGLTAEVSSISSSRCGQIVAAAATSKSIHHAEIRFWGKNSKNEFCEFAPFGLHKSTILQMEFNPKFNILLAASKDRSFSIMKYHIQQVGKDALASSSSPFSSSPFSPSSSSFFSFSIFSSLRRLAHSRLIWSCTWHPNGTIFATASRDKTVKLWKINVENTSGNDGEKKEEKEKSPEEEFQLSAMGTIGPLSSSCNAIGFSPFINSAQDSVLAIGLESGGIQLWTVNVNQSSLSPSLLLSFPPTWSHGSTVRRLRWNSLPSSPSSNTFLLSSCSDDQSVRIFEVKF